MKLSKEEFSKLQKHWYQRLADTGFKDVEELKDGKLILTEEIGQYHYRKTDAFRILMKEEYFRAICQMVQDIDTRFRNSIDKYILSRYSEGAKIKTIMVELSTQGCQLRRNSIRFIIRRYEVQWGLKSYGPNQLNVYK
jgi:ABC-type uncharacterized transport system ATPase subunit